MGLFTPALLPQGTRIWEFNPLVDWTFSRDEFSQIPERLRVRLRTYCYLNGDGVYVLCGDNARFMNHSDNPNCDDSTLQATVTKREILAGEELTCDYRIFDFE